MAQIDERTVDDEYSRQYFQFTPSEFIQDFTELLIDEITLVVKETIKQIQLHSSEHEKDMLLKQCDAIHEVWVERAAIASEELKPIICEVFTIPKNVSIPLHRSNKNYTDEEITILEQEVKELKKQYVEEMKEIKVIEAKLHILEMLEPVHKKIDAAMPLLKEYSENVSDIQELKKLDNFYSRQEMFPNICDSDIKTRLASLKFEIKED